jgi:methylated-DNA-[protein]-cysteine S-methyltransferase
MRPGNAAETTYWHEIDTPIGSLLLAGSARGLSCVGFQAGPRATRPQPHWVRSAEPFGAAASQLAAYFAGSLRMFHLVLAPQGTPFQLAVWGALQQIPYGETLSYGELARGLGHPQGARAVGLANGANPLPIIVPCHRVIGADGSLTGFGGGLPIKRALLALEGAACVSDLFSAGFTAARPAQSTESRRE